MVAAGIAARKEDAIQVRAIFIVFFVLCHLCLKFDWVGKIHVGRDTVPMIQTIFVADLTDFVVHHIHWVFHQRIDVAIVKRDVLDAVGAKKRQFSQVFFILIHGPGVPGVGSITVSDLMASDGVFRGGGNFILFVKEKFSMGEFSGFQQLPDGEDRSTLVCSDQPQDLPAIGLIQNQTVTLGSVLGFNV